MIIDNHTHVSNEKRYGEYHAKTNGMVDKSLVLHYDEDFDKLVKFVDTKKDLFLIARVFVGRNIPKQLKVLDSLFRKKKIFGIKLYPGYEHFYPSDKKIFPIAKLCQKYNKPLIFHSGDVYNPEGGAVLKYAHPLHIDELAVNFPKCRIVISHLGFPFQLEAATVVSKNENVFTDLSGTIDQCPSDEALKNLVGQYRSDLVRILNYYPNLRKKVMFGTDFGGEETSLNQVSPYIDLVNSLFNDKERENVFHGLAEKLYFS